jgi:predicted DNA-binding transcriptional regulator YafY
MRETENLKPILKAIKEKRKIAFEYFNFHKNKKRKYNQKPYLNRKYQNRWYILGIVSVFNDLRTFGVDRIENLEAKTEMDVQISEMGIKIIKTKWGSCNIEERRIWLNLELAKKPESCIEYILVHEMMHFFERHHTERFSQLMDYYLPDWRLRRDELNKSPLAHEEWKY